jgi:hypothetical protein
VHLLLFAATLLVDLTGNGNRDKVVLTQAPEAITVTVTYAGAKRKAQTFQFGVDSGREDAVCGLPVELQREGAHGFMVVDHRCDSLHFAFDRKTQRVEWWRL